MLKFTHFLTYWHELNNALAARGKRPACAGLAAAAYRHMRAEEAAAVMPAAGWL